MQARCGMRDKICDSAQSEQAVRVKRYCAYCENNFNQENVKIQLDNPEPFKALVIAS